MPTMISKKRADTSSNTTAPPAPYVLTPTGEFNGNDGDWSTFWINVGDSDGTGHGQNFKVLISTSSALIIVPGHSEVCDSNCAEGRGLATYNSAIPDGLVEGKSWKLVGTYELKLPEWWFNKTLTGKYGTDNVGLGQSSAQSLILTDQYVVQNLDLELYMGLFGLAYGDVATSNSGSSKPPFLTNFFASNQIPSKSFGYTAGAKYSKWMPFNLYIHARFVTNTLATSFL